ncbi:MAG TPA: phytanoyl-CoA dioxygenase family protein [Pyrinomonadaceae bacterium]|jgi:phytanoyl-CoA hydroxylase
MKYAPEAWKKDYRDDGFVVIREFLDPATLYTLRECLEKIVGNTDGLSAQLKEKIFFERDHVKNNPQWYAGVLSPEECGRSVRQIEDMPLFDAAFAELICYQPLLDVLETLFESDEFSFNYLNGRPKAARVGNGISNGNFHRDTPFEDFTFSNTIIAILCLDDMTSENGAISFIQGSHKIADEEAKKPFWREVAADSFKTEDKVVVRCPAGSAIFFNTKILHAAGHNRSEQTRYTLFFEWVGPNVLPTSPVRYAYQGLKPRSKDPAFEKQIKMTFPEIFAGSA